MEYKHLTPKKIDLIMNSNDIGLILCYNIKGPVADFKEKYINENWYKTKEDALSNLLKDEEPEIHVKINKSLNQKIDDPKEKVELCTLDAEIELSDIDEENIPEYISAITERLDNLLGLSILQTVQPKYEGLYRKMQNLGFKDIEITDEN